VPFNAEDYVHRIGRTGRAGASGLAVTLVSSSDARLVSDIEKLIKKKIDLEPLELDEARPPREERPRRVREEAAPGDSPRPVRSSYAQTTRAPRDPFFDKPYEPSSTSADAAAWDNKTPAPSSAGRGLSPNIKPKKKVAALFGSKPTTT
jgi:superfamily II DNA/RNA helicase